MTEYVLSPIRTTTGFDAWRGALSSVEGLGRRAFVVGGVRGLAAAGPFLEALAGRLDAVHVEPFRGECSEESIAHVARNARGFNSVIGVGGGKAIDTAKAAAVQCGVSCATVPTSAATCAAYTPLSILHTEDGAYVKSQRLPRPVAVCIVDPELMLGGPTRLLAAGCIDALARAWDTCLAAQVRVPSLMAEISVSICSGYWDRVLRPHAASAIRDQHDGRRSEQLAQTVDACIVGAGLAGETGARFFGRSFSHAVGYALANVVDNDTVLHGEAVGLGILVQCALDPETPVSLPTMLEYFKSLSAPTRFADLGFDVLSEEAGRDLASATYKLLDLDAAVPFSVTPDDLYRGLLTVEQFGS